MFDHIGMAASNLELSKRFYSSCLAPLGISLLEDHSGGDGPAWLVYGTSPTATRRARWVCFPGRYSMLTSSGMVCSPRRAVN